MTEASKSFANGASGEVNAFVKGAMNDRIYTSSEKTILQSKTNVNLKEQ